MSPDDNAERAAEAERSVTLLYGGRLLGLPGTHLARVAHPRRRGVAAVRGPWHYWWQAHYLDALVDAGWRHLRAGRPDDSTARASSGHRLLRTIRLRNVGSYPNHYYDDMAWLVLAAHRLGGLYSALGGPSALASVDAADRAITPRLRSAATTDLGGGVFWNTTRDFKNVPATGPVALHLARSGRIDEAQRLVDWMYERLQDPGTGLFLDGIRVTGGSEIVVRDVWTYNQGTVLGSLLALGDPTSLYRAAELVAGVREHLTTPDRAGHPLVTHGGHDGGLFTGILTRYLALAAGDPRMAPAARTTATAMVIDTAEGVWRNLARRTDRDATVFPVDPTRPHPIGVVELSTQLQAWTVLEAAATLP